MDKEKSKKRKVTIHIGNGSPMAAQHFNRNSLCRCGSGKKTKHCCGTQTKYFYTKIEKKETKAPDKIEQTETIENQLTNDKT